MKPALVSLLCLVVLFGATPAPSAEMRVFVSLRINAVDQGETVAIISGKDVLVPVASIEGAGIRGFTGRRMIRYNVKYVSLASLAPDVSFTFDEDALMLNVTAKADLLPSSAYNLSAPKPAHLEYVTSDAAYLNYALTASRGGSGTGFVEGGFSSPAGMFYSSISAVSGTPLLRGLTYFERDDRTRQIRRTYGDTLVQTGDLGGSAFIAGYASSRAFDLDPYTIHFPLPSISGAVTSPSTAEIYVNGLLTNRIILPPGNFNLSQLPVANGSANTSVVVTDAFGHEQTYEQGYYSNASLLVPGTTDFEYAAGMLRESAFQLGDRYDGLAAMGHYRIGLTNSLTAGVRFETKSGLTSFGPSLDIGLPVGFVHLAGAVSREAGISGSAYSIGYSYTAPRFGLGLSYIGETASYATLSQDTTGDRALSAFSAFASMQISKRSTVGLQYFHRIDRDGDPTTQASLTDTLSLGRNLSLTVTGERDSGSLSGPTNTVSLQLNIALDRRNIVVANQIGGTGPDTSLQLQQSPPGNRGLSYVANVDHGVNGTGLNATMQYRGSYGDYGFDYANAATGDAGYDLRATGGIALIGGGLFATRPIDQSYALVDLPGVPGVHVYLDNQDMGKTDAKGRLLVTGLIPNYGNLIRISDEDAPLDASIQTLERTIAPPTRGGAVVTFPVQRVHAVVGKILVHMNGTTITPAYGDMSIDAGTVHAESAIGDNGEFYLEDLPPGNYPALVTFKQGTCTFVLKQPTEAGVLASLGTLECTVQ